MTSTVQLVRPSTEMLHAAVADDGELARALGCEVVPGWVTFPDALRRVRNAAVVAEEGIWGTRFFVASDPTRLVGWGGFKGPPRDGVVELGYEIVEGERGRGLATSAVRAMLGEAMAFHDITTVIAHTLPERSASTRVLERTGFAFDQSVTVDGDPQWRFRLTVADRDRLRRT